VIIDRQMTDEEAANVAAGETVTITEGFTVDKAKLSELAGK
jgi:hypothetical protein